MSNPNPKRRTPDAKTRTPDAKTRTRKSGGVVVVHRIKWQLRALAWLVFALVRTGWANLRYRRVDRSGYIKGPTSGPAFFSVWPKPRAAGKPAHFRCCRKHKSTVRPGV